MTSTLHKRRWLAPSERSRDERRGRVHETGYPHVQLVLLHCFGRSNPVSLVLTCRDVPRRPRKPFFRGLDSDVL